MVMVSAPPPLTVQSLMREPAPASPEMVISQHRRRRRGWWRDIAVNAITSNGDFIGAHPPDVKSGNPALCAGQQQRVNACTQIEGTRMAAISSESITAIATEDRTVYEVET